MVRTAFNLNDSVISATEFTDDGFRVETMAGRQLNYINRFQNSLTIELSRTREVYTRQVYSYLNFVSELGGLFSAINSVLFGISIALNFNGLQTFLMSEMF